MNYKAVLKLQEVKEDAYERKQIEEWEARCRYDFKFVANYFEEKDI